MGRKRTRKKEKKKGDNLVYFVVNLKNGALAHNSQEVWSDELRMPVSRGFRELGMNPPSAGITT